MENGRSKAILRKGDIEKQRNKQNNKQREGRKKERIMTGEWVKPKVLIQNSCTFLTKQRTNYNIQSDLGNQQEDDTGGNQQAYSYRIFISSACRLSASNTVESSSTLESSCFSLSSISIRVVSSSDCIRCN